MAVPTDIANLTGWWLGGSDVKEADASPAEDGDTVSNWNDASGNGRTLTATAGAVVYKTNIVNGQSVCRFNGANGTDQLSRASAGGELFDNDGITTFTVWSNVNTSGASPWILSGPTPILAIQQVDASNCRGTTYFSGSYYTGNKAQATGGAFHISTLHFDGAASKLYYGCDDTRTASMANVTVAGTFDMVGSETLYVGQSWGVALVGDIAEMITYDRALTEGERTSIEAYLAAKYAITIPYGSGGFMLIV